ncbi:chorismate mutase family protein [Rhodococcus sp. NPDC056743]|uniref:chorismate mutase family protein n=1 Tax=Rhodococcus sp. NPDC056743 TaxID=3345934 RepID=UPI00366BA1E9
MADFQHSTGTDAHREIAHTDTHDRSPGDDLERFRRQLDAIDATLLETVRERLLLCLQIGEWKRSSHVPMMQPSRVHVVQERARQFARQHNLSPEFFSSLYELLIAETCRLEDLVIDGPDANMENVRESVGWRSGLTR